MAGMRNPPSSNSVFFPVKGQVSAKRSPPLSLVKITIVFSVNPFACKRLQYMPNLLVHFFNHSLVCLLRTAVEIRKASATRLP